MKLRWAHGCFLALAGMLLACVLSAQQITFRTYGQREGLANLSLSALLLDSRGFLWIASEAGAVRYDGARFVTFGREQGIPGMIVTSLAEDSGGHIWAGTTDGLAVFINNRFLPVKLNGQDIQFQYGGQISAGPHGDVYGLSTVGPVAISPETSRPGHWTARLLATAGGRPTDASKSAAILALRDGAVLYPCGTAICENHGAITKVWSQSTGVPTDNWQRFYQDHRGRIWARGSRHIIQSDPAGRHFSLVDIPGRTLGNSCSTLLEDDRGRMLTCTDEPGMARFADGRWELFGRGNGFGPVVVNDLAFDREGVLWLALGGRGLQKWIGYPSWQHWTENQGLQSDVVYGVLVDSIGQTWVANDKGLDVADKRLGSGTAARPFHPVDLGPSGGALGRTLAEVNGEVWAGTKLGRVFAVDRLTHRLKASFTLPPVARLTADSSGRLWAATRGGIFLGALHGGHRQFVPVPTSNIPGARFYDVSVDPSQQAYVASSTGILRCDPASCSALAGTQAIAARFSDVLVAGPNTLWAVGSFPGLARITLEGLTVKSYTIYRAPELRSDNLIFIGKDPRGRLWAGTDAGVEVLDNGKWRGFTEGDGLVWNDTDGKAFFAANDIVWIGTSGGLSRLDYPAAIRSDRSAMMPGLEATVDDRPLGSIAPAGSPLLFTFLPMHFRDELAITYRYRLLGVDRDWVNSSSATARYAQIPDGTHRFELQTIDTSSRQASPIVARAFEVPAPWWRSRPVWLLATIMFLLGARMIWKWRIRALIEKQCALELLVEERTAKINSQLVQEAALKDEAQQASRAKSDFLAMMSHEIRTPMNGVIGMATLLGRSPLTGEQLDWVATLQESGQSLLAIINDILDFSKIEAGKLALEQIPFSIAGIVEQVEKIIRPIANHKGLSLSVQMSDGLPLQVVGDPLRVRQVLLNLLSNAVKFTEIGSVRLDVQSEATPDNPSEASRRLVSFRVTDTGIGISVEAQRKLFQQFGQADVSTTRQYGGTGLGLAICKLLSELMGGRLSMTSESGKGSTFVFSACFAPTETPEIALAPELVPPETVLTHIQGTPDERRILIAEDNAINRKVVTRLLDLLGYSAITVENGADAVNLLREQRFDAVLMDCQMPLMDGFEATSLIREAEIGGDRTPIIALTANALVGERQRCLAAGMDDYLSKPINIDALRSALDLWVSRSSELSCK